MGIKWQRESTSVLESGWWFGGWDLRHCLNFRIPSWISECLEHLPSEHQDLPKVSQDMAPRAEALKCTTDPLENLSQYMRIHKPLSIHHTHAVFSLADTTFSCHSDLHLIPPVCILKKICHSLSYLGLLKPYCSCNITCCNSGINPLEPCCHLRSLVQLTMRWGTLVPLCSGGGSACLIWLQQKNSDSHQLRIISTLFHTFTVGDSIASWWGCCFRTWMTFILFLTHIPTYYAILSKS